MEVLILTVSFIGNLFLPNKNNKILFTENLEEIAEETDVPTSTVKFQTYFIFKSSNLKYSRRNILQFFQP